MLRGNVRRTEGNAPIQKQAQFCLHGMRPRFHDHKAALGDGFQFVRRHEWPLHHLQTLAGTVLTSADRAGQYRTAAQCLGELLRRLAVGGEAAEDGNQRETVKVPIARLREVLPQGLDAKKTEDFIIKACDHYRKYLIRQRNRDER